MAKKKSKLTKRLSAGGRTDKRSKVNPKPKTKAKSITKSITKTTSKSSPKQRSKKPLQNAKQKPQTKQVGKSGKFARPRKTVSKPNTKGPEKSKLVSANKVQTRINPKRKVVKRGSKVNERKRVKNVARKQTRKPVKKVVEVSRIAKPKGPDTKIIKGFNTLAIKGSGKPENLSKRLKGLTKGKQFKYLLNKNKPVKGAPPKEPKAVVLIYTVTTDEGVKKTFSKLSPNDFIVNAENVQRFIESTTENISDDFDEMYGGTGETENTKVNSVAIKFIY